MHLAFNQDYIVALLSTDFSTLSKELEESAAAKRKPVQARPFLLCLKASDGSELWRKTLPPGESVNSLCAANGLFAYSGFSFDKNAYSGFLKVCGFAKGEVQWQVKLKNESEAQPFFAGDSLVFVNGGTLNAVSSDGASKLWSLKLGERYYLSENAYKISEDQLFILGGKGLACVDLKERKIAWESSLPCNPSELHVDAGRIFIVGYPGEGSTPLPEEVKPPTLESLKDADLNSAAILNKAAGSFKSSKPAVFAFDGKDGKELWRKEHLLGSLVCGDGRLAFIYDSAKTQMASIIGGTLKGDMCITQLAPASGKEIVSGSDKIGMEAPYAICGEMLLGVVYDRDSSTTTLGMGKAPPIRKLGFAAFKLK